MKINVNRKEQLMDIVPLKLMSAYLDATNTYLNNSNPCQVCKDDKNLGAYREHFHASSDIGGCQRKTLYSMIDPSAKLSARGAFLEDGHLHEKDVLEKFASQGLAVRVAGNRDELRQVINTAPKGAAVNYVMIVGHYDGILYIEDKSYVLELKAVGANTWRRIQQGEISDEWYGQIQFYLKALDLPVAYLVVKNRETSTIMTPIRIDFDEEYLKEAYIRLTTIYNAFASGSDVDRKYKRRNTAECRNCPFFAKCWGMEIEPVEEIQDAE